MTPQIWAFAVSVTVTLLAGRPFIRRVSHMGGQPIRREGPATHLAKAGTPTMGGALFVAATLVVTLAFAGWDPPVVAALALVTVFAAMGFVDDLAKVRRQASLGLRARTKLALGIFFATAFAFLAMGPLHLGTYLAVPLTRTLVHVPEWVFLILVNLVVIGSTNAVNLTDGLDGLAGGLSLIAVGFYSALAYAEGSFGLGLLALVLVGAVAGFLAFNLHPARLIMGDTGALGLGAALSALAVLTRSELLLPLVGAVFVVETVSVVLQVVSFRLTGRRIFRMSPLHHHFELGGWTEGKVTRRFWLAGLVGAMAAYLLWW